MHQGSWGAIFAQQSQARFCIQTGGVVRRQDRGLTVVHGRDPCGHLSRDRAAAANAQQAIDGQVARHQSWGRQDEFNTGGLGALQRRLCIGRQLLFARQVRNKHLHTRLV